MGRWPMALLPEEDVEAWKFVVSQAPDSILFFERVRCNTEQRTTREKHQS